MHECVCTYTCLCQSTRCRVSATSICSSITIDVMYLPLLSSAEVCMCVCVCVLYSPILLLDLTATNTDSWWKREKKILSSSRSHPESDRQTVWDCREAALISYRTLFNSLLCQDSSSQEVYFDTILLNGAYSQYSIIHCFVLAHLYLHAPLGN